MKFSRAFTMIEMIFVIVVIGILASVAFPKLAATRTDAEIVKGRADVAAIRSAIVSERQTQLIRGTNTYIPKLSSNTTTLFTGDTDSNRTLLMYGIKAGSGSGHWSGTDPNYTYRVGATETAFTYNSSTGTFACTSGSGYCDELVD